MTSLATLWRTVRHLKIAQVTGRVAHRLRRPAPQTAPPPPRWSWAGPWVLPAARRPSLLAPQRFSFLGVEGELVQLGWYGPGAEKLWRYNQHYFDDLIINTHLFFNVAIKISGQRTVQRLDIFKVSLP